MLQKHYQDLSERQIEDKLKATINWFIRRNERRANGNPIFQQADNPAVARFTNESGQFNRRLPTKSIYCFYDIDDEDFGLPLLLYGDVKLRVQTKAVEGKYGRVYLHQLYVHNKESGKLIRFFNRGKRRDDVEENVIYHLAAIVVYGHDKNNKLTCTLYKENSILFSRA